MTKEWINKLEELPEEITQNAEERTKELGIMKEKVEKGGVSVKFYPRCTVMKRQ